MKKKQTLILTINGGSSSIKFALYSAVKIPDRLLFGKIERIGLAGSTLTFNNEKENHKDILETGAADYHSSVIFLIDWLEKQVEFSSIAGVGHRVVFGMEHSEPELITQKLLGQLHSFTNYDPDHLPAEIELIEAFRQRHPRLLQVACFDTAFHRTMPRVAKLLPIPLRFDRLGIQRYGFHGLSYAYLMEALSHSAGTHAAKGLVILAHLGNGASMAAVRGGKSIDTSMGFTPAAGLMMGTRPGDLDPGVAWYMMRSEHLTIKQFNDLINQESGLLGVSETSADMRDLLSKETTDIRAAEAIELFCYQAKKWIGAFAATLGGLDTLVFSGGIGENCPVIRSRICAGLEFLGISLDEKQNKIGAPVISKEKGRVAVRVIHTDEEWMIAKTVGQIVSITKK